MKKLLVIAVAFLVVIAAGALVLILNLGRVVKAGVEKGGSLILGVPVSLESVSVSLTGSVGLEGLKMGSPEGFSAPRMFRLGRMHVNADPWSLRRPVMVVHEIIVDGPDITMELAQGKANWSVLTERLKREPEEEKTRKQVKVGRIVVRNGTVRMVGLPGSQEFSVPLPTVELTDLSSGEDGAAAVRDVLKQVMAALYQSQLEAMRERMSPGKLQGLPDGFRRMLREAGEPLEGRGSRMDEAVGDMLDRARGLLKGTPSSEEGQD